MWNELLWRWLVEGRQSIMGGYYLPAYLPPYIIIQIEQPAIVPAQKSGFV